MAASQPIPERIRCRAVFFHGDERPPEEEALTGSAASWAAVQRRASLSDQECRCKPLALFQTEFAPQCDSEKPFAQTLSLKLEGDALQFQRGGLGKLAVTKNLHGYRRPVRASRRQLSVPVHAR